ncbi:carnosine N-methyltransferase, partial [Lecanoromycetidae sp. Uapishka_2]
MLETFDQIDAAIDSNAEIATEILKSAISSFKLDGREKETEGATKPSDIDKARSTIRQFYRDWSAEGASERYACYEPVLFDVASYTLNQVFDKENVRVLVPGAGLGRLVFELCKEGYTVEGNEISYHQIMASSWIFNHIDKEQKFDLYPFAMEFNNLLSRTHQLQRVVIPDVHVGSELDLASEHSPVEASQRLSMTAGDFITLYTQPNSKEKFDVVTTVFFIDTAPNLITYIAAIHHCLKPQGQWINLGPLLWHFGDRAPGDSKTPTSNTETDDTPGIEAPGSFELTEQEVELLVVQMGFEVTRRNHEVVDGVGYIQNPSNLMNSRFKGFGGFGSKRTSSRNGPTQQPSITSLAPSVSTANGVGPHTPPGSTSSTTSLPINNPPQMNNQGGLGRPPSYTYNPNAPRATSPMPPGQQQVAHHPPPINTGAYPQGHPALGGAAQQPPGYGGGGGYGQTMGAPQPTLGQYGGRSQAVEVEGAGRSKAQLIVGIDFGTTFSGVAFAFATNTEAKEDIITEWPGAGNQTKQKIPTVLYYDQYQKVVGWGPDIADALAPTGYPKPGVQKVEWFKLQLMLSGNTYIDPINLPPLPPGKSEIDVAADYLFKLRQAMRNQLQKTLGEVFNREERNIRYFLTVPAIWNDAGKAATRAAAIQAGFLRDENDNRLTLITEPEAAAMFCAKTGLLNLKIRDAVLIVDCGGGTVDLIAYEVEEETPFTVAECTAGSGDSCGSTALNRNFSNILRAKIRKMKLPDGSKTAGKVYAKCIMDFENRIKADFRNNGQKWAVDVGIEAEFPEAGIEEGYMTFTNEEILQCFEPVVNRILELVRNQIIAIQAQNRILQNVLVVGGFGASEYLFQQIKLHVPPQFQAKVVRPMDSVAAIVKGAVTAGITERVITSRVARRHYLMATLQPFKEGHHPEQYRVPSLDGKDRCKYTRQIFVQKGQRVKNGEPVKVSFFRQVAPGATLMYEDILYACDEDVCPEYTKDPRIKEVVTLTSDLSRKNLEKDFERMDTPQGTFYRVYFDILLALDGSEFNAELVCQGEVMGRCTARFR